MGLLITISGLSIFMRYRLCYNTFGDTMLDKFVPDRIITHYRELTVEDLKKENIKLFLCDIDNTLVEPDEPDISDEALKYLASIKSAGIEVVLISNNTHDRVKTFNHGLNLKVYPMALKPFPKAYRLIKADYPHIKTCEMLSLGDQVMTDVLGSNLAGIKVVLTNRFIEKDLLVTRINRLIEKMMIKILKLRKKWPDEQV